MSFPLRYSNLCLAFAVTLIAACSDDTALEPGSVDVESDEWEAADGNSGANPSSASDTGASETFSGRPSAPYSDPWPLALTAGVQHGFPAEELMLDCDPRLFRNVSPAVLRETTHALIYGTVLSVEVPQHDFATGRACEGDRWDGLRMIIDVEGSFGSFASGSGTEVAIYVPTDQLLAWTRRPWWDSTEGVARWSDWLDDNPQPVPVVGGRVLISSVAVHIGDDTDNTLLQALMLFSISPSGEVVPQADRRRECHVRLEIDGEVPAAYGHIDALWRRIAEDELTDIEREYVSGINRSHSVRSSAQWVHCAE